MISDDTKSERGGVRTSFKLDNHYEDRTDDDDLDKIIENIEIEQREK